MIEFRNISSLIGVNRCIGNVWIAKCDGWYYFKECLFIKYKKSRTDHDWQYLPIEDAFIGNEIVKHEYDNDEVVLMQNGIELELDSFTPIRVDSNEKFMLAYLMSDPLWNYGVLVRNRITGKLNMSSWNKPKRDYAMFSKSSDVHSKLTPRLSMSEVVSMNLRLVAKGDFTKLDFRRLFAPKCSLTDTGWIQHADCPEYEFKFIDMLDVSKLMPDSIED